jgi:pilus assembly protein CpaE
MENIYPLQAILAGVESPHLTQVRVALSHAGAEIESEFPSMGSMLECLRRSKDRPRMLVLQLSEQCNKEAVERLGEYFAGWPILALMPDEGSLEEIQRVYRAGARQVVQLPLDQEDFHHALKSIAMQIDRGGSGHQVFAVAGVTGGCGATTLAINLAYEIAQQHQRHTVLAELTMQVGALTAMLDIRPQITLPYLLREIQRVDDLLIEKALVPYGDRLRILAGANEVGSVPDVDPHKISRILDALKKASVVTVLDVPGTFNDTDCSVLYSADHVILVGLQNVPSVRALKLFCEMFPEERLNHSLWVAINRYNPHLKGYTRTELKEMLGTPNLVTISNDYQAAIRAMNHGEPLRKATPETPILRDLDGLIHSLFGIEKQQSGKRKSLFGRLANALNL